jgi:putative oxidoreductase
MMKNWATLPLRLGLGVVFMAHGAQKAFGMFDGPGISGFSKMLSGLGLTPTEPLAYIVAYIELLGGLCLILGLFTRVAASLIFTVMAVALLKVHLTRGFFLMNGGYEYVLVILAACLSLVISGPGAFGITKKI